MVEAMFVGHDADVCESAEEHERSEFELLVGRCGCEATEQCAGAAAFEVDAGRVEDTPNKTRTIERVRSFRAPAITRAESLIDRGRLLQLRFAWFDRESAVPLLLLALWPIAQLHAVSMLFAMGPTDASLLDWAHEQGLPWLPPRGAWAPAEFIVAEAVVTTAAVLSVGLAAAASMQPHAPRARLVLAIIGIALFAKTLTYGLRFGGDHALAWLTPGAVGGLAIGLLAAIVASWGPPRAVGRLALLATVGLIVAVSLVPENPYFASWQSHWRTGRLAHFTALGEWVAFAWPFAALAWLITLEFTRRTRRSPERSGN